MHDARHNLIVALDVPSLSDARRLVEQLDESCTFYKIGVELLLSSGLEFIQELKAKNKQIFLDMKLLDIGNTVERATASAARLGVRFLTVHAHDRKTLEAARAGRGDSELRLLGVTVLTNLGEGDLTQQGINMTPAQLSLRRAGLVRDAGIDGIVASAREAEPIRLELGESMLIVTPGIRPAGTAADDQQRVSTPASAIAAGADYLVVGRPITRAPDPRATAELMVRDMAEAFASCGRTPRGMR